MNWRTDKPTANLIIAKLNNGNYSILERLSSGKYCIQDKSIGYDILHGENMVFIYEEEIQKWADLEEDETVTDCRQLEEEIDSFLNEAGAPFFWCNDDEQRDWCSVIARHFAKWGAEHTIKELEPKIKLAYGKVSMNPFDCCETFEELLDLKK